MCTVCETSLSYISRHDQTEIEEKLTLLLGSELRRVYLVFFLKDEMKRKNTFVKSCCESFLMKEASYELAYIATKKKKTCF